MIQPVTTEAHTIGAGTYDGVWCGDKLDVLAGKIGRLVGIQLTTNIGVRGRMECRVHVAADRSISIELL